MIRLDLEAAGIEYQTNDGFADFHALRHSFITLLGRNGTPPAVHQELARHSDYRLTRRYSHVTLHDKASAAESLPPLLPSTPEKKMATGA